MRRILNWHFTGNPDLIAYYAEGDFSPGAIRLIAPNAPGGGVCQVDIRDDGVSILESYAELSGGEDIQEIAEHYANPKPQIEEGSVITCHIIAPGGVSSLSVQLVLESLEG